MRETLSEARDEHGSIRAAFRRWHTEGTYELRVTSHGFFGEVGHLFRTRGVDYEKGLRLYREECEARGLNQLYFK